MCRLKIGNPVEDLNEELCHVAVANKHGLIYAVSNKTGKSVLFFSLHQLLVVSGQLDSLFQVHSLSNLDLFTLVKNWCVE